MSRLVIDNLTKDQAKALAHWFEGQGEQNCAEWLECRKVKAPTVDVSNKPWLREEGDDIIITCKQGVH